MVPEIRSPNQGADSSGGSEEESVPCSSLSSASSPGLVVVSHVSVVTRLSSVCMNVPVFFSIFI